MPARRSQRAAIRARTKEPEVIAEPSYRTARSRRTEEPKSMATVSRGPSTSDQQSMRFTVKTSSSKLREATRSSPIGSGGQTISVNGRDSFVGGEIIEGKRPRNRKSYVVESSEDDQDMDDLGDEDEDEEEEEEDDEDEEELDADDDAFADADADGDIDMEVPLPPPTIKFSKVQSGKTKITVKESLKPTKKTVEQKEVAAVSDDELSELDSDMGDDIDEEAGMQLGDEDAEGEDEEIEVAEDDLGLDSDEDGFGSQASTPDVAKLTKRQRAKLEEGADDFLISLPDDVQTKKILTAEEHQMRRAEMARRRKNLSEKRNEEEKMETINKLLKKQAPKTNARRNLLNGTGGNDTSGDSEALKPNPIFVRWTSDKDGNRVGVPEEWLDGPLGDIFKNSVKPTSLFRGGKLVQEVE